MKRLFFILSLMISVLSLSAQTDSLAANNNQTKKLTLTRPMELKIMKELSHNMHYPDICKKYRVEGKANVSFVMDSDGSISDVKAEKVKILNIGNPSFVELTEAKQNEYKEKFAKKFFSAAVTAVRGISKSVWKEANNGTGRVNMTLPITFILP